MAVSSFGFGNGRYRTVRLDELVTDGRFNRPVSEQHVHKIMNDFKVEAFGSIILWERDPGEFVILDGQHRVEAVRKLGVPEGTKCIPSVVHSDLTLSLASQLFVLLNQSKLVAAYDKFHALLTAGDLETSSINQIVRSQGLTVGPGAKDGCISAVAALRRVYGLGEPEGAVLALTLATLKQAWDFNSDAYRSALLRGLGLFFHEHREMEPDFVAVKLINGPGAPINLLGWAKGLAGTQRMPLDKAIAQIMETRVVNRKGRGGAVRKVS